MIALQKLAWLNELSVKLAPVKSAPVKSALEKSLPISVVFLKLTRLKEALVKSENFNVASEKSAVSKSESIADDLEIKAGWKFAPREIARFNDVLSMIDEPKFVL